MSNLVSQNEMIPSELLEKVLLTGDLSVLKSDQKVFYYQKVCESVGLNPLTKPFEYIRLQGKETLYARKEATDQLRKIHNVSIEIIKREVIGDIYLVTARARIGNRQDESTGGVYIKGLIGEALVNAYLKSESKAKRRATLSICGLSILDESEVHSVNDSDKAVRIQSVLLKQPEPIDLPSQESVSEISQEILPASKLAFKDCPIPGEKYKGKMLSDISPGEAKHYCDSVKEWHLKENRDIGQKWQDFIEIVEQYLSLNSEKK